MSRTLLLSRYPARKKQRFFVTSMVVPHQTMVQRQVVWTHDRRYHQQGLQQQQTLSALNQQQHSKHIFTTTANNSYCSSGYNGSLSKRSRSRSRSSSRRSSSTSRSLSSSSTNRISNDDNNDNNNNNNNKKDLNNNKTTIPFYGRPSCVGTTHSDSLSSNNFVSSSSSWSNRLFLAIHSASTAIMDPSRAEAVAALGEVTGTVALRRIHQAMMDDPTGRQILLDRPIVSQATLPKKLFGVPSEEQSSSHSPRKKDNEEEEEKEEKEVVVTFGQTYANYLKDHGFHPDERDDVKYIHDPDLAYVMLRYRQCHDYWHALTGLPPTVVGELALKWLELFQTGLPIASLSCTVGSLALSLRQQQILWNIYIPWALRVHKQLQQQQQQLPRRQYVLMTVYYEKEFDTPVEELQKRLGIEPAPIIGETY